MTKGGGQVKVLGKARVQKVLARHTIARVLSKEGGRTSRGTPALTQMYVALLNRASSVVGFSLDEVEQWWVARVNSYWAAEGPRFRFDTGKSLRWNIDDLLDQAEELQRNARGTSYVGAMLQHLVGAKLDLVMGVGVVAHHGYSVADQANERNADFQIDAVAIHVTTRPSEALVQKCAVNLSAGLMPVIITTTRFAHTAESFLKEAQMADRVDVLDTTQFLTANVFERSLFRVPACKVTLSRLVERYNEIVADCESDPSLKIRMGGGT